MTYRSSRSTRILSSLAMALLVVPSPYAAIDGTVSTATSFGGLTGTEEAAATTLSATHEKFTAQDLAIMRERRLAVDAKITSLQTEIAALKASGATDEASKTKLRLLEQDLADNQELKDVVTTLIAQAVSDLSTSGSTINTGFNNIDTSGNGSSSGGSGGGMGDTIKQAAVNALMQSFLGNGNNALQNLTGGLTNGLGNLTGGLTGGLAGNQNAGLNPTGGNTGANTGNTKQNTKTAQEEKAKEKDPYEGLPNCGTTDTTPGKEKDDKVEPTVSGKDKDDLVASTGDAKNAIAAAHKETGKEKDDKVTSTDDAKKAVEAAAAKAKCRPIDVTTPNPTGQGVKADTACLQSDKITSIEDARKFVGKYWCDPSNSNCASNGQECASLTKYFCPDVGRAGSWQGGSTVKGGNIAVGTCVATFSNNGNYGPAGSPGGASGKSHTGVYLGQNSEGVILLHQWNGSGGARISTVPWSAWGRGGAKQGGNVYKTIGSLNVFKGIDWYLPPITIAFNIPLGEGLAKQLPDAYNEAQGLQS